MQSGGFVGDSVKHFRRLGKSHGTAFEATKHENVELVFCNPDLLWKSDFPKPRLGQGAFRDAFQAVYRVRLFGSCLRGTYGVALTTFQSIVGHSYPYVQYGKPTAATYKFAEGVLRERLEGVHAGRIESMPRV